MSASCTCPGTFAPLGALQPVVLVGMVQPVALVQAVQPLQPVEELEVLQLLSGEGGGVGRLNGCDRLPCSNHYTSRAHVDLRHVCDGGCGRRRPDAGGVAVVPGPRMGNGRPQAHVAP
eukprot:gene3791-biopygen2728